MHPDVPTTTTARFDLSDPRGYHVTVLGERWDIPPELAVLPPYDLVASLHDMTGRWHIIPEPKPVDAAGNVLPNSQRLPARGAHEPEPGVLVVDVEEIHPAETRQTVPYLVGQIEHGEDLYVHPGETEPRPLDG